LARHALQINPLNLSNNEARGANISAMKLGIEMDKEKMLTLVKRVAVILLDLAKAFQPHRSSFSFFPWVAVRVKNRYEPLQFSKLAPPDGVRIRNVSVVGKHA
jgi:hypothetical protein